MSYQISVRADNLLPKVEIRTPDNGQRVLKNFTISSLISDLHLVSYQLDFSTTNDSNNSDWEQIYVKESLYQPTDKTELEEVETNKDWEISVKDEQVWLRLIGTQIKRIIPTVKPSKWKSLRLCRLVKVESLPLMINEQNSTFHSIHWLKILSPPSML